MSLVAQKYFRLPLEELIQRFLLNVIFSIALIPAVCCMCFQNYEALLDAIRFKGKFWRHLSQLKDEFNFVRKRALCAEKLSLHYIGWRQIIIIDLNALQNNSFSISKKAQRYQKNLYIRKPLESRVLITHEWTLLRV